MSSLTINDLPNELISKILRQVDQCSLRNAALTCTLWKEVIERTCSWPVTLCTFSTKSMDFVLTTNRRFGTMNISALEIKETNKAMDILSKHGFRIRKLTLMYGYIRSLNDFVEMLKLLPNLEHLSLIRMKSTTKIVPDEEFELPKLMMKLKTLNFVDIDIGLLKCFEGSKLNSLKLHNRLDSQDNFLKTFLLTQKNLKKLYLLFVDLPRLDGHMPFQLSTLSVRGITIPNENHYLIELMKLHAKTLTTLELGSRLPNFVYEFVFSELAALKSLLLDISDIPEEIDFYQRLRDNKNINNLILLDSRSSHLRNGWSESLQELFRHLPNITNLTALMYSDRLTTLNIPQQLHQLKQVDVKCLDGSTFTYII